MSRSESLTDEEAQRESAQIFEDVRAKVSADPTLRKADGDIYLLRKDVSLDNNKIRIVFALEGGPAPEKAEIVRIIPVGLNSYFEVTSRGGETKETINHKTISFPATMHDVALYRQIADSLE